jgi:GNAT superfamily N-acetyltransferase
MSIVFRHARADELQRAQELVVASINDMTERHGFGPMASVRPPDFQLFSMKDDPDGLWIAEDDGRLVGYAFSWICGDLWFLAELFVAPDRQGAGIGKGLLRRTFDHAARAGVTRKALITFTFNTVSQGLYIRHGLLPRMPIYFFNGTRQAAAGLAGETLSTVDIAPGEQHLQLLRRLDDSVMGLSRDHHHRFLLADPTIKGALLYRQDELVAYAYVSTTGHVGPLAVAPDGDLAAAFRTAVTLAAQTGSPQISCFLPGIAARALGVAAECHMKITFPMVLVSDRDFGDWTRYLPRNPGFM